MNGVQYVLVELVLVWVFHERHVCSGFWPPAGRVLFLGPDRRDPCDHLHLSQALHFASLLHLNHGVKRTFTVLQAARDRSFVARQLKLAKLKTQITLCDWLHCKGILLNIVCLQVLANYIENAGVGLDLKATNLHFRTVKSELALSTQFFVYVSECECLSVDGSLDAVDGFLSRRFQQAQSVELKAIFNFRIVRHRV